MDYQKVIEVINNHERYVGVKYVNGVEEAYVTPYFEKALDTAISAMQELDEYKQLGTLEEVREAVERQQAKKPLLGGNTDKLAGDIRICPYCSGVVGINDIRADFCADCGQRIDWSEEK